MFSKTGSNGSCCVGRAGSQQGPALGTSSALHQQWQMNAQNVTD